MTLRASGGSNTIDVPFDWNDCLLNLSLNGLQNCSFFQQEIGIINNPWEPPTAIIDLIEMNLFIQYNGLLTQTLHIN